jgi:hypothetical protein
MVYSAVTADKKKLCEDCDEKSPSYGMPGEKGPKGGKVLRWCVRCAQQHEGSLQLVSRRCEGCNKRQCRFGMPGGKAVWCSFCAKDHPGSADVYNKKCEDCGVRHPTYCLPDFKPGGGRRRVRTALREPSSPP